MDINFSDLIRSSFLLGVCLYTFIGQHILYFKAPIDKRHFLENTEDAKFTKLAFFFQNGFDVMCYKFVVSQRKTQKNARNPVVGQKVLGLSPNHTPILNV